MTTVRALLLAITLAALAPNARADDDAPPSWLENLAQERRTATTDSFRAAQKVRLEKERELKKLRMEYFRRSRPAPVREQGLLKLHDYAEPALFPSLVEIFATEAMDVRIAVLDVFRAHRSAQGDATLMWQAVFDSDNTIRAAAADRLVERANEIAEAGKVRKASQSPLEDPAKLVIYQALTRGNDGQKASAARVAATLGLVEAIPWLIAAQAQAQAPPAAGTGGSSLNGERNGALAWILVGTQQAFVSDLTPVVGPNAVAFDPQLSVVTDGVIMRVLDAAVITYHVEINAALIDLSSRLYGQSTSSLGWDLPAWREWYAKQFTPYLKRLDAEYADAANRTPIERK